MRWLLLTLFAALLAAVLYPVKEFDASSAPRDEVLAYEVTSTRKVQLPVHAGISLVTVVTWPVLPWGAGAEEVISYGIEVLLSDPDGKPREYRRHDARSRVTVDPDSAEPSARLADGSVLVGGSRSLDVDVSPLAQTGGTMTITAARGGHERVLLLATHTLRRTAFEQAVLERSVGAEERARVIGQRSSLGFFDLPAETRVESLAYRVRRLTALGREGTSYQTRRLLLGDRPEPPQSSGPVQQKTPIGPARHVALNVSGPIELSLAGDPGLAVATRDGAGAELVRHVIPAHGLMVLSFEQEGVRTLFLQSERESKIAMSVSETHGSALVGDVARLPSEGRLPLFPDIRRFTYYRLSAVEPVSFAMLPGQTMMGFSARVALTGRESSAVGGWFEVEWLGSQGETLVRGKVQFRAKRSLFDTLEGAPLTDAERGRLRVPKGAQTFRLRGITSTLLSIDTDEPGVERSVLEPTYAMDLAEEVAFKNAPFTEKTWTVLRPDNADELERNERAPRVHAQVRIEDKTPRGQTLAERSLPPVNVVQSRYVFAPTTYSPRFEFPANAWTQLDEKDRWVVVPAEGRLDVVYMADPEKLGETWGLSASGEQRWSTRLTTPGGRAIANLSPGPQPLRTWGLGRAGTVMVQAPPRAGGKIFKRHKNYALTPTGRLRFKIERDLGELVSVVLIVTTLDANQDVLLSYRLRSQTAERPQPEPWLYRRQTALEGQLQLRTGVRGRALVWSAEGRTTTTTLPDRVGSVTIPLGDDLRPGARILELRQHGGAAETIWVRAVAARRKIEAGELRWSQLVDRNERVETGRK